MSSILDKILKQVNSLNSIEGAEKSALLSDLIALQKEMNEDNFKIMRLNKDKSIIVNFLKTTISDLEKSNIKIEESNKQLLQQQAELKKQKQTIETKSRKLAENLKRLKRSYNELEDFAHIASHDLKSPLRSISGFSYLLQKRYAGQLDDEADRFLDFIVSSANHMNEIIEALLDYSQVGIKQKNFEEIDLNDVMNAVELNLLRDIEDNNATIVYKSLPKIKGDKVGLVQLFQNLVANAIKFKSDEPPVISIKSEKKDSGWKFEIIDNGIGMDESFQEKVFFPFQRLEEKESTGLGLGLAICKKVVKLHEGQIYYTNNAQGGTTFILELPFINSNELSEVNSIN